MTTHKVLHFSTQALTLKIKNHLSLIVTQTIVFFTFFTQKNFCSRQRLHHQPYLVTSGYKQGMPAIRLIGEDMKPQAFDVYSPKILAAIARADVLDMMRRYEVDRAEA